MLERLMSEVELETGTSKKSASSISLKSLFLLPAFPETEGEDSKLCSDVLLVAVMDIFRFTKSPQRNLRIFLVTSEMHF